MKGIILAAGIASRLRPLTDNTPKCLLKIGDKPLLQRAIDALLANNINDIIIVTGYLNKMIEKFIETNYPETNISFIHNPIYATTNNIYSLWLTKKEIIHEDKVILLDSDILFEPQIIQLLLKSEHKNCLALNSHHLGEEEIKVIVNENNQICEISKTCSIQNAIGESIGIEKISKEYNQALFQELDQMIENEKLTNVFYELAFERLIKQGYYFYPIDTSHLFSMELDTVEDFNEALNNIPQNLQ